MKRNLIFYCYFSNVENIDDPTKFALSILNEYKNVFSGRKIIYAAFDNPQSIDKEKILNIFSFLNPEIRVVNNNGNNRESEHFIDMLMEITDNDSCTFYAHNKGSTHKLDYTLKNWILSMYFFNLEESDVEKVESDFLSGVIMSGILRKKSRIVTTWRKLHCDWHYSGAFFWINTKELFLIKDWDVIEKGRMSLEFYPGDKIPLEKSTTSFVDESYNFSVDMDFWKDKINPNFIGEDRYIKYMNLFN